jgi:predicted nucleic acid-binding protein
LILADTSIWVEYLRKGLLAMKAALDGGQILIHPVIVAEIALGSMQNREKRLEELDALRQVKVAELGEVRRMIEARSLYSKGIGLSDAHLLASCLLTPGVKLWTRDSSLEAVAKTLGVLWSPLL